MFVVGSPGYWFVLVDGSPGYWLTLVIGSRLVVGSLGYWTILVVGTIGLTLVPMAVGKTGNLGLFTPGFVMVGCGGVPVYNTNMLNLNEF